MTTRATSTKNIKMQRGDGATPVETFTTLAEVTGFKGPSEKASALDATSFDSAAMEFIGGLTDGGEVSLDLLFIGPDAGQQGLRTDLRAGTKRNFKLVLNDQPSGGVQPTSVAFTAVVTAAPELSGSVNQVVKSTATLKVSGLPTWTYAA